MNTGLSITRRILFAVSAGWFSKMAVAGLNLALMPILFRNLGQEQLGLWFLLGQSGAFSGLMDFGFGPTLMRRIALVKGRTGCEPNDSLNQESLVEISDLIATGRVVYRLLALFVFVSCWFLGMAFLRALPLQESNFHGVWIAWLLISMSYAINTWAGVWSCLLSGMGYVGWDSIIAAVVTTVTVIGQIVAVLCGGGLVALAAVSMAGGLATRFATLLFVRRRNPELFRTGGIARMRHARDLAPLAVRAWLTSIGAFLILKTDQYFIAYYRGPSDISAYQAAYQVVSYVYTLAISFSLSSSVFVSQLWQANRLHTVHTIVRRNLRVGLGIMVSGVAVIQATGERIFETWLGPGHFVGYPVLLVFCAMLTLEAQHVIISASSRATEDEPFAPWAICAGILNLILTWILIQRLGLLGVALGTLLAQLFTNNWFAVSRGLRRLRFRFSLYAETVLEIACLAAVAGTVSYVVVHATDAVGAVGQIGSVTLVVAISFGIFVWWAVLERTERARIVRHLRRAA